MDTGVRHKAVLWPRRGILAVLATGPLFGCSKLLRWEEDRSQLPILLEDPMAAKDLLGLTLKEGTERGYRRPLGKPQFTEVWRTFSLGDGDRQEVFDRAVAFAKESGWKKEHESGLPPKMVWRGQKIEPRRGCSVFISDDNLADLIIILRVVEVP